MDEAGAARDCFPFVVGCGRSGTTLVRAMFDSHPRMAVPPETTFILSMAERRDRYERPEGFAIDTFLTDLERHGDPARKWGLGRDAVREALATGPRSYADAVRSLFALYARRHGKDRFANKTPVHVLEIARLARLFPEARFVHVIRDGRDVALSYLDSRFGPDTVEAAALRWKRWVRRGREAGRGLGEARYREILYEDLVEEPETTARSLCGFLGLEFDERMLRYDERAEDLLVGIPFPQHHQGLRLRPTKGLRDWRAQMPAPHIARFESLAGSLLSELGYDRAVPRPGLAVRGGAAGRALLQEVRRVMQGGARRVPGARRRASDRQAATR